MWAIQSLLWYWPNSTTEQIKQTYCSDVGEWLWWADAMELYTQGPQTGKCCKLKDKNFYCCSISWNSMYTRRVKLSNFPHFSISSNINSWQNGAKMYPSCDVREVRHSIALREKLYSGDDILKCTLHVLCILKCSCSHTHACICTCVVHDYHLDHSYRWTAVPLVTPSTAWVMRLVVGLTFCVMDSPSFCCKREWNMAGWWSWSLER